MRASLDTNVIIHLYKAGMQSVLFDIFDEGVFIYEQIRKVELEHHGQEVLELVDADLLSGKIELYSDQKLEELKVYKIFENKVNENKEIYKKRRFRGSICNLFGSDFRCVFYSD